MGRKWLTEQEFYVDFLADEKAAAKWRAEGMPYERLTDGSYIYPKWLCHKWHAGESVEEEKEVAKKQAIHFGKSYLPLL